MGDSSAFEIDAPTMRDLDRLVELWVDLAAGQREYDSHLRTDANRDRIRESLSRQIALSEVRVARRDDRIVGFVMFTMAGGTFERSVTRGLVQNIYVLPEARGDGIGSRLLEVSEDALAAEGADTVALDVMAHNDEARAFYEQHGYAPHRVTMEKPTESDTP